MLGSPRGLSVPVRELTVDPDEITVMWDDHRRITSDGTIERWDPDRQEWVREDDQAD